MNILKKYLLLFFVSNFILSCSTSYKTHNMITKDEITFKGGNFGNREWDEDLVFDKYSYYYGSKLLYQIMFTELERDSNFMEWLGTQKTKVYQCDHFYLTMFYKDSISINSPKMPISSIRKYFTDAGLVEISIPEFAEQVSNHFTYDEWNLQRHKKFGYCAPKGVSIDELTVFVPGFKAVKLLPQKN